MKKLIWAFLTILIFSCGCATTSLKEDRSRQRSSPPNASQTRLSQEEQKVASQDAYENFKSASELIVPADMSNLHIFTKVLKKGWGEKNKNLEKLLSDNEPAFKEFQNGLDKKQLTLPAFKNYEERRECLFVLDRLRELTRLLNLKFQFQIYKKDYVKAMQCCFDIARFGQLLEKGGNSLSKRMGMAIESNGYKNLRDTVFLQTNRPNYPHLLENIQSLQKNVDVRKHFEEILKKEFVDIKFNVSPLLLSEIDWQEFLESYQASGYTQEDVEQSVRACYANAMKDINLPYNKGLKAWALEENPQNPVRQIFMPVLRNMYIECGRLDTERNATFIIIGLEYYYNKNKQYPGKLSDLVPTYLPYLPNDPFSAEPFIYQRKGKGWIMYSIGNDLKNDFGQISSYLSKDGTGDIIFYKE